MATATFGIPLFPQNRADSSGLEKDGTRHLLPDLAYKRLFEVNGVFYGKPAGKEPWVLTDAGVPGTLANLKESAAHSRPPRPRRLPDEPVSGLGRPRL